MEFEAATVSHLAARLTSKLRPRIDNLNSKIFPNNGPYPREIAEISGETGVGKTTLLLEIMAKVILPTAYGGKDGMVLFLITENNFNISKLMAVMEKIIRNNGAVPNDLTDIIEVIKKSLQNIMFRRCFNDQQLELGILKLDETFHNNNRYSLLAVDNIAAFYWMKVSDSNKIRMDIYTNDLLKKLIRVIDNHQLVLVYTKPAYYVSNSCSSSNSVSKRIDYLMQLIEKDDQSLDNVANSVYKVQLPKYNKTFLYDYDFNSLGINWLK